MEILLQLVMGSIGLGVIFGVITAMVIEMPDSLIIWLAPSLFLLGCVIKFAGIKSVPYIFMGALVGVGLALLIIAVAKWTIILIGEIADRIRWRLKRR